MLTDTQEFHVFRVRRPLVDGRDTGWQYYRNYRTSSGYNEVTFTPKIDEAFAFDPNDVSNIIDIFTKLSKDRNNLRGIEFVKVEITTKTETVSLEVELFIEERRRLALAKLDNNDIAALGLEKLASYDKLRYGGVADVDL